MIFNLKPWNHKQKKPIKVLGGLAEYLGVHRQTVYNWKKKGLLKYKEIGRIILFEQDDFLKENKRKRK